MSKETKAAETKAAETDKPEVKKIEKGIFKGQPAVKIKLPLTRTEKDDVWVSVNGKAMQIKRGVEVEVPQCVVEVLQHQEDMLKEALEYENAAAGKTGDDELN